MLGLAFKMEAIRRLCEPLKNKVVAATIKDLLQFNERSFMKNMKCCKITRYFYVLFTFYFYAPFCYGFKASPVCLLSRVIWIGELTLLSN